MPKGVPVLRNWDTTQEEERVKKALMKTESRTESVIRSQEDLVRTRRLEVQVRGHFPGEAHAAVELNVLKTDINRQPRTMP
jgi:hypothetical protein